MINNILVICLGNICRSPMAEGILKSQLPGKTIQSAGISALVGHPADPNSVQVMQEQGIDISAHGAQSLVERMVSAADLILTMDLDQKRFVEKTYFTSKGKVMRLGEFGKFDIGDPYKQNIEAFRLSYRLITQGVNDWSGRILQIN